MSLVACLRKSFGFSVMPVKTGIQNLHQSTLKKGEAVL